ncbi:MAG: DUF5615 family PIN-like protein [Proteobacteria bacterium]|nr:DUF5615 family PIN-like protein [Pseudomonadota bacterium]MBU2260489.1 DUF5615 family PIN-like protein [Pseudomonadota bacterium]
MLEKALNEGRVLLTHDLDFAELLAASGGKAPSVIVFRLRNMHPDRVHQLLSERLANIRDMFGQIPDTLEDVWVAAALRDEEEAKRVIDAVPKRHPFEMRYDRIENVDWESCSRVLDSASQLEALRVGW